MLRLTLITASNRQPDWVDAGADDYARRLRGRCSLAIEAVALARRTASTPVERAIADVPSSGQSKLTWEFRTVEDESPVDAVLREAPGYDLVVIGVSEEWGLESHVFGLRPERIAEESPTSMLIVRSLSSSKRRPSSPARDWR